MVKPLAVVNLLLFEKELFFENSVCLLTNAQFAGEFFRSSNLFIFNDLQCCLSRCIIEKDEFLA